MDNLSVFTSNPMFKDLKCYKININGFKAKLKDINIDSIKDAFDWSEIETIEDYIFKFLTPITNKIQDTVDILYNKNKVTPGIFEGEKKPFKGQIPIIQSSIDVLDHDDFVYIGADMGCGKTLMAIKANHNYFKSKNIKNYNTLIVAPAITLTQWKEEILDSIADKVNIIIIKKTEDFIKWNNQNINDKPNYILIGKETFKLSYAKKPCYIKTSRVTEVKEMDDYWKSHVYYSKRDSMYSTSKTIKEVLTCPNCSLLKICN